jgi:putative transposase
MFGGGKGMPRQPRYSIAGFPQHVIQRGNNRQTIFFDDRDHQRYLDNLAEVSTATGCRIHAFVLMTNHVHMLVTPPSTHSVSEMMQGLGRRYVGYINRTYGRTGTLWEGRFKSCLVSSDEYLLACMRYIELNPVRAGMIGLPGDYKWSSFRTNALGENTPFPGVQPHAVYRGLGSNVRARLQAYRALFESNLKFKDIEEIRAATNSCLVLGGDSFKDRLEQQLQRRVRHLKPGPKPA